MQRNISMLAVRNDKNCVVKWPETETLLRQTDKRTNRIECVVKSADNRDTPPVCRHLGHDFVPHPSPSVFSSCGKYSPTVVVKDICLILKSDVLNPLTSLTMSFFDIFLFRSVNVDLGMDLMSFFST